MISAKRKLKIVLLKNKPTFVYMFNRIAHIKITTTAISLASISMMTIITL